MKDFLMKQKSLIPFMLTLLFSLVWLLFFYDGVWNRLLITSDQLGYRYYQNKEYVKAAETFENSAFKGVAYYRAGEFKKAKSVYQNLSDRNGKYNLGNTNVMLGHYDDAIEAYELAIKIDPDFKEAKENLVVAKARKILKEPENDGEQGVGELGADEIVFDNKEGKGVDDDSSAEKEAASGNPNWLDRLHTGPKDFLKNKFRYQYEMQGQAQMKVNNEK
ncbi:TPR domain protein in aerotolerance operon [hydrothermal vent metagenome]|uniref:TPR domain protein in aerotolerance operon n=1 Tax=hydrothermal vent metagenome TaxID=652676 RepID=A0A1W1EF50_9ZZZZ